VARWPIAVSTHRCSHTLVNQCTDASVYGHLSGLAHPCSAAYRTAAWRVGAGVEGARGEGRGVPTRSLPAHAAHVPVQACFHPDCVESHTRMQELETQSSPPALPPFLPSFRAALTTEPGTLVGAIADNSPWLQPTFWCPSPDQGSRLRLILLQGLPRLFCFPCLGFQKLLRSVPAGLTEPGCSIPASHLGAHLTVCNSRDIWLLSL